MISGKENYESALLIALEDRPSAVEAPQIQRLARNRFEGKFFNYGDGDYMRRLLGDAAKHWPIPKLLGEVIPRELGAFSKPFRASPEGWSSLLNHLEDHVIATIVDPIVPSTSRPFTVIPYLTFRSGVILCSRAHITCVERCATAIGMLLNGEESEIPLRDAIRSLIIDNYGQRLAVTEGVLEDNLLRFLQIPIGTAGRYKDTDIVSNAVQAIGKERFVLLDYPSAVATCERLISDQERIAEELAICDFFGERHPLTTTAGFALHPSQPEMIRFFWNECVERSGHVRAALDSLDANATAGLERLGISLIPPAQIHPVDINAPELWLMGLFSHAHETRRAVAAVMSGEQSSERGSAVITAPRKRLTDLFDLLIMTVGLLVLSLAAGFGSKALWASLGIFGGVGTAALLISEARHSVRGPLYRICFYAAGLILAFESVLLIAHIVGK
ncbi:MAG: hypothetical protein QOG67_161 [Verrucomicrobiota bacterium]|jgi:hypothetical protein